MRRLKAAIGLWKIQTQWVVTPGKQTTNTFHLIKSPSYRREVTDEELPKIVLIFVVHT
jgi:hypothetical protein